jgi:hypothetical protein
VDLDFTDGITVGGASDLFQRQRGHGEDLVDVPTSDPHARGLSLRSLTVTGGWDKLWNLLRRKQQIYFLSIAFDLSGSEPTVLPPKEVPEGAVYPVRHGEAIEFTLGEGAPVFLPRLITGGLVVYITVCEADKGVRHVGETMAKVHEDLTNDDSLIQVIKGFIANPGKTVADEVLGAATAALQPIATILKSNGDDYVALFAGVFSAKGPWEERLRSTQNGATIELAELR